MTKIVFIAPDKQQYLHGQKIINQLGLDKEIDLYLARLNKAVSLAKSLENEDVSVIVSRGGTAQLIIDSQVKIPVVEISVTGQDFAQLFQDAKNITGLTRPKVFLSVFQNMLADIEILANIMGIELTIDPQRTFQDIPRIIERISHSTPSEVDVVVGGKGIVLAGGKAGFKSLLIRSGNSAFQKAFLEAKKISLARTIEKEQAQQFQTLVEYSSDAIINIDHDKIIRIFNPTAERLLNCSAKDILGRKLDLFLDFINIDTCLHEGHESIGNTVKIGTIWLSYNVAPIIVDKAIVGAIITLQDITRIQEIEARIRNEVFAKKFVAKYTFPNILGTSKQLVETKRIAHEFARVDATVLITGESGTGKELFAQSIHNESRIKNGPFVALNCAALPPSLLESELFGYVEGAFTGATKKGKPGLFEMAHRGTIFLDEISGMDMYGQSRLLRVLQERQVMRLGDDKNIPFDVRIIAATNKNLAELVKDGKFRQDLFYRLKVLTLKLPPLRNREGDVKVLAQYFMDYYNKQYFRNIEISPDAFSYLSQYLWPGNVRELMSFIERLIIIARENFITCDILRKYWEDNEDESLLQNAGGISNSVPSLSEKERIIFALDQCHQNKTQAAEILGMDRTTLYRKLRKYEF